MAFGSKYVLAGIFEPLHLLFLRSDALDVDQVHGLTLPDTELPPQEPQPRVSDGAIAL